MWDDSLGLQYELPSICKGSNRFFFSYVYLETRVFFFLGINLTNGVADFFIIFYFILLYFIFVCLQMYVPSGGFWWSIQEILVGTRQSFRSLPIHAFLWFYDFFQRERFCRKFGELTWHLWAKFTAGLSCWVMVPAPESALMLSVQCMGTTKVPKNWVSEDSTCWMANIKPTQEKVPREARFKIGFMFIST